MRRVHISGSIMPEQMDRAIRLARVVDLKPSELVPIGLGRVLDEIERNGCLTIRAREVLEEPEAPRRGKRPHPLFDN